MKLRSIHSFAGDFAVSYVADPLSNVRRYHKARAIDDNHEVVSLIVTMIQI